MSVEISVEIEVYCICGRSIHLQQINVSKINTITVDPCPVCLAKAERDGMELAVQQGV